MRNVQFRIVQSEFRSTKNERLDAFRMTFNVSELVGGD